MCCRPRLSISATGFFYPLFLTAKVKDDNRVKLDDLL